MTGLRAAGPLDVNDMLVVERARLLATLADLAPDEWELPTECPAWDVKGIALHILGDDLSLLSRQRDEAVNGLVLTALELPGADFRTLLNEFNERWVHVARFFGTPLIIELLRLTGDLTSEWYRRVPPDQLGEPVLFVGFDPAPYWMIAGREYYERWVHLTQIARAIGRGVPHEAEFVVPAMAGAMRGFPQVMKALDAPRGSTLTVQVDDAAWTVQHDPTGWAVYDGRPEAPTVALSMTAPAATSVFTRGLPPDELRRAITVTGDDDMGAIVMGGLVAMFGRQ